jgi:hypothetical protein
MSAQAHKQKTESGMKQETNLEHKALISSLKEVLKLLLGPLLGVEEHHHDHVHAAHHLFVPRVLGPRHPETVVINNNAGAGLEGWDEVLENLDGIGGRVVVDDPAEEVDWRFLLASAVLTADCL